MNNKDALDIEDIISFLDMKNINLVIFNKI